VLPQSDTEAFLWARRAAEAGLAKAMYAVGYFLEVGIGAPVDPRECVGAGVDMCRAVADGVQVGRVVQARGGPRRPPRDPAPQGRARAATWHARGRGQRRAERGVERGRRRRRWRQEGLCGDVSLAVAARRIYGSAAAVSRSVCAYNHRVDCTMIARGLDDNDEHEQLQYRRCYYFWRSHAMEFYVSELVHVLPLQHAMRTGA
jgi:hypothetical protein